MNTIKTAAYAAVAATASNGLLVAEAMIDMKTHMKPVMMPSRRWSQPRIQATISVREALQDHR